MPEGMLGMLSLDDIRGPRNALEERLAGKDGSMWLAAFKRFLRKENPWLACSLSPEVFIEQKALGCFSSANGFFKELKQFEVMLSTKAHEVLVNGFRAQRISYADLYLAKVAELGFPNGATLGDVLGRIRELGYGFCPVEIAPTLVLPPEYTGLEEKWRDPGDAYLAMEPAPNVDGQLMILHLIPPSADIPWRIGANWGFRDFRYEAGDKFLFIGQERMEESEEDFQERIHQEA